MLEKDLHILMDMTQVCPVSSNCKADILDGILTFCQYPLPVSVAEVLIETHWNMLIAIGYHLFDVN